MKPATIDPINVILDPTEARKQRGLAIAALSKITKKNDVWVVPSQSGPGSYQVTLHPPNDIIPLCTCEDFKARNQPCKHYFAVQYVIQREKSSDGTEMVTETLTLSKQTIAKRPTYKQNWRAYNAAQTNEKSKFQVLLHELCQRVPEPPRKPGPGRKPIPLSDIVFAVVFKVYSTFSARRFQADLNEAFARGFLSKLPRYNTVFDYFEDKRLIPILRTLIIETAKPLKSIEDTFAVDSSGFSTSRFIRWFDHKYGVTRQKYDWVKCHLTTGVKTNIVTAIEIDEKNCHDSQMFTPLLDTTAKNFRVKELSGDAAYLSYENMEAVAAIGGTPYIAFKSNTTAAKGGMFETMFHLYSLHRDEFLAHYHLRSNAETTFSMIKAKFGDSLRSKTDVAMVNEALAKVLCHNVCVVIQSQYELGIETKFWRPEPVVAPSVAAAVADADAPYRFEFV